MSFPSVRILGFVVATDKGGHVNSFAWEREKADEIFDRSNQRHDDLIDLQMLNGLLLQSLIGGKRTAQVKANKQTEKGILGPCILRRLSNFDVGKSFLVDSLHNVYLGAFVSSSAYLKARRFLSYLIETFAKSLALSPIQSLSLVYLETFARNSHAFHASQATIDHHSSSSLYVPVA